MFTDESRALRGATRALVVLGIALGSSACFEWEYGSRSQVHAVGEVRDYDGRTITGVEVRLIKHWPLEGDGLVEPPPEVLFAEEPTAPDGAPYGVELVAVARTDEDGWFDMLLDGSAIADPRFEPDFYGRIVTARTIVVVRAPASAPEIAGAWSYSFRFGGWYTHHCELLTLARTDAKMSTARLDEQGMVDVTFARGRIPNDIRVRSSNFVHQVGLAMSDNSAQPFFSRCEESQGTLSGCDADPENANRLRIEIPAERLSEWFSSATGELQPTLASAGPLHRSFASVARPADPTLGGTLPTPTTPTPGNPSDPNNPGNPTNPTDPGDGNPGNGNPGNGNPGNGNPGNGNPGTPTMPAPLPLKGVWAVGDTVRIDLAGTPAVDGDPLTRYDLDSSQGIADSLYVQLGDVNLTEAGILNTVVAMADLGCMVVQTSPSVYRSLEGAIDGLDWTGNARFCGSTGARDEVSALQRFATSSINGKRAGWLRILPVGDDPLHFISVGEVIAVGYE